MKIPDRTVRRSDNCSTIQSLGLDRWIEQGIIMLVIDDCLATKDNSQHQDLVLSVVEKER